MKGARKVSLILILTLFECFILCMKIMRHDSYKQEIYLDSLFGDFIWKYYFLITFYRDFIWKKLNFLIIFYSNLKLIYLTLPFYVLIYSILINKEIRVKD